MGVSVCERESKRQRVCVSGAYFFVSMNLYLVAAYLEYSNNLLRKFDSGVFVEPAKLRYPLLLEN